MGGTVVEGVELSLEIGDTSLGEGELSSRFLCGCLYRRIGETGIVLPAVLLRRSLAFDLLLRPSGQLGR